MRPAVERLSHRELISLGLALVKGKNPIERTVVGDSGLASAHSVAGRDAYPLAHARNTAWEPPEKRSCAHFVLKRPKKAKKEGLPEPREPLL